jgi:hypothetical protein
MITLATDIVHMYRVVNHVLVYHNTKTTRELAEELYLPQRMMERIFTELQISIDDNGILKRRKQSKIAPVIATPDFVARVNKRLEEPMVFKRPTAVYNNSRSPYGIADELHKHPEKFEMVEK